MMSVLRSPRFPAFGLEFTIALLNNCTFSHKRYIEIKRKLIRKIFEDKGQGGKSLGLQQREFISWRWGLFSKYQSSDFREILTLIRFSLEVDIGWCFLFFGDPSRLHSFFTLH